MLLESQCWCSFTSTRVRSRYYWQTPVECVIADARHNKALENAIGIASMLAPGAISTITPGDDDPAFARIFAQLLNMKAL